MTDIQTNNLVIYYYVAYFTHIVFVSANRQFPVAIFVVSHFSHIFVCC